MCRRRGQERDWGPAYGAGDVVTIGNLRLTVDATAGRSVTRVLVEWNAPRNAPGKDDTIAATERGADG